MRAIDGIEPADALDALREALRENERLTDRSLAAEQQVGDLANALRGGQQPPRRHRSARGRGDRLRDRREPDGLRGDGALRERARNGHINLVAACGVAAFRFDSLEVGTGVIGAVAETGRPFVRRRAGPVDPGSDESITACLPLRIGTSVVGVLAIFRLLPHKGTLENGDLRSLRAAVGPRGAGAALLAGLQRGPLVRQDARPARPPPRSWTGSRTPTAGGLPNAYLHAGHLFVSATPCRVSTILGLVRLGGALRSGGAGRRAEPLPAAAGSREHGAVGPLRPDGGAVADRRRWSPPAPAAASCRPKCSAAPASCAPSAPRPATSGRRTCRRPAPSCSPKGFPIVAEDVDGERGRKLIFQTHDGSAWVRSL